MKQSIRCAPGVWHYKTQAQVWRKQLLNHTAARLPSAAVNNENTDRGRREAEGRKGRWSLETEGSGKEEKKIGGTGLGDILSELAAHNHTKF